MRRLARILFTLYSAASLLLCIAVCVLWVRSYVVRDVIEYDAPARWDVVTSSRGRIGAILQPGTLRGHAVLGGALTRYSDDSPQDLSASQIGEPTFDRLGFSLVRSPRGSEASWAYFGVPHWSVALLSAAAPGWWCWRRRGRKPVPGHCSRCGYDLRASPERCPECGAVSEGTP